MTVRNECLTLYLYFYGSVFFFYCSLESTEDWLYNALLSLGQHSASWRVRIHGNRSVVQTKTQGSTFYIYPSTQPSTYLLYLSVLQIHIWVSWEQESNLELSPRAGARFTNPKKIHPDWRTPTMKSDAVGEEKSTSYMTPLNVFLLDEPLWSERQ